MSDSEEEDKESSKQHKALFGNDSDDDENASKFDVPQDSAPDFTRPHENTYIARVKGKPFQTLDPAASGVTMSGPKSFTVRSGMNAMRSVIGEVSWFKDRSAANSSGSALSPAAGAPVRAVAGTSTTAVSTSASSTSAQPLLLQQLQYHIVLNLKMDTHGTEVPEVIK